LGRNWFSPPGSALYSTLILKPQLPPYDLPKLTLVAAVALSKTIARELHERPLIKWPNDLYLQGKKISGILTELSGELGRVEFLLLGVGVNVNQHPEDFPEEIREKAGSLRSILGKEEKISRSGLLRSYLQILEDEYFKALRKGFAETLAYCRQYSATLGRQVEVSDGERVLRGKAVMIEEDGSLTLEVESGARTRVFSGDVSLVGPDRPGKT
jgi:BirA family biotin operon repressor/biotin-[acetyl-CoA-carboxylase] ligase